MAVRRSRVPRNPAAGPDTGVLDALDPGALTVLLADEHVRGLQVRRAAGEWVTVQPVRDAFIVNVGDQVQVHIINRAPLLLLSAIAR